MGGVFKVFNPVEHVKAVTSVTNTVVNAVPLLPQPVKDVVTTVNNVHSAHVQSVISHPVNTVNNIVAAVEKPTLQNIIAAVPGDPVGLTPTPAQIVEDVKDLANANNVGKLLEKIGQIGVRDILKNVQIMQAVYTIVTAHWNGLQNQAATEGKWKKLSQRIIDTYQNHYQVDLSAMRYAENINTQQENTAITFPGEVFFPRTIDPENNAQDLHWLLHEMAHLDQYKRLGGLNQYLDQYSSDIVVKIVTNRTFNVHDLLEYEKEADCKADQLCHLLQTNTHRNRM